MTIFKKNPLKKTVCVIVLSGKGGTGKTTVSSLLAMELSNHYNVGATDCDIRAPNLARALGVRSRNMEYNDARRMMAPKVNERLSVFSTELLFKESLGIRFESDMEKMLTEQQVFDVDWGFDKVDVLLADMEPAGIDPLAVLSQLFKGRVYVVLVTTPKGVSLDNTERAISICTQYELPIIGIIANMVESECPECHTRPVQCKECGTRFIPYGTSREAILLADKYGLEFFGEIYSNPDIGKRMDMGDVGSVSNNTQSVIRRVSEAVGEKVK